MLYQFILITLRRFKRDKFFTLLNVLGLSLGIATTIVILSYVSFERSYDGFHKKRDNIYRVLTHWNTGNRNEKMVVTGTKIAHMAANEIPEVEEVAKFFPIGARVPMTMQVEDRVFKETDFAFADPSFFKIFDFKLIAGDPSTALEEPNNLVITEAMATKYFGDTNAIGQMVTVNGNTQMMVSGILANPPANSSLPIGAIASFKHIGERYGINWFPMNFMTFVLLKDQTDTDRIADFFLTKAKGEVDGDAMDFSLQPLTEIYMQEDIQMDIGERGNKQNTTAFLLIGVFILIIACINYINLVTAQSEKKSKEVGIRKVLGSGRHALIRRFLGETAVIAFVAILLAVVIVEVSLPFINQMINGKIPFDLTSNWIWPVLLTVLGLTITALAGSYPALFLSSFQPVAVLKGTFLSSKSGDKFRKILVVFQFSISIFLIIGTLIIYKQVIYGSEKNLGFDQEQIIVVPLANKSTITKLDAIQAELNQHPAIQQTSKVSEVLGSVRAGYGYDTDELINKENASCVGLSVDRNGISTMGLQLIAGTDFNKTSEQDSVGHYIVNRQLINDMGWTPEEAIGKDFTLKPMSKGKLIGVVEDFHFSSLREKIGPVVLTYISHEIKNLYVSVDMQQSEAAMTHIHQTFQEMDPLSHIEPVFLMDELDNLYREEVKTARLMVLFTGLSIFIGCLGLLGLTAYLVEKKYKEIGIRKILGASVATIIKGLSWRFLKLILLANVLIAPIAYLAMSNWLDNFAYTISIGWELFAYTCTGAMSIGFLTVFYHSYLAATSNPAEAIRSE